MNQISIQQLDGNISLNSSLSSIETPPNTRNNKGYSNKNAQIANHLPVVSVCNTRSFFPKICNFKTDFLERQIDVGLLCEVWQQAENKNHSHEIEKMLEVEGLKYFSTIRPNGKRGGGAAILVNLDRFSVDKLEMNNTDKLEICWALAKPKSNHAKVKIIILCSFYCPPRSRKKSKLIDHIICTLQTLTTRYPGCGICLGGDRNNLDITQILNSNMNLVQMVTKPTRKGELLDIFITNLSHCYNVPDIIPPVQPDDPNAGVPSDHHVPLCIPHTDPLCPPRREFKVVVSRPLPESKLRRFGQWITTEDWTFLDEYISPQDKVDQYNKKMFENLDRFCPTKRVKLGMNDKPYITAELKTLKRRRHREYCKRGKSKKYYSLKNQFETKYLKAAQDYMTKNKEALKQSNPAQTFGIFKRMGAPPGQLTDTSNFTLEGHETLSIPESAERIANHFSSISQEFPPLSYNLLPERVLDKIGNPEKESPVPKLTTVEVYKNIQEANKPKSGVPWDLPRTIVSEFAPEIATPMCSIYNSILESAKHGTASWPPDWKVEWGTPLQKIPNPKSEDNLRIISLTAFLSKVMERFVMAWLMVYVGDQLDPGQYGGLKKNSIAHYLIEMINFILYNQDYDNESVAVLACAIDYSKAFNRINHNILVTKLSDMGVPGWLLNLVMGFLTERKMKVRYKGNTTDSKQLPGGGPQGSLLGGFLFLILINLCGFPDQDHNVAEQICNGRRKFVPTTLHAKYVDDMTILESIDLKKNLVPHPDPNRPRPDPFRCRTGHALPSECSQVYDQINVIQQYAEDNQMKLNYEKTKFVLFNPCRNYDFLPEFSKVDHDITCVEELKLLGLHLRSDLSWVDNTDALIKKAFARMWTVKRLMNLGAELEDLKDVYFKQIRSVLEFGVPVWNCSITKVEVINLERVQKAFLRIVLKDGYKSYSSALEICEMETLEQRRLKLCETFAIKSASNPKYSHWFKLNTQTGPDTRSEKTKYCVPVTNTQRFKNSPIVYLTKLLNTQD